MRAITMDDGWDLAEHFLLEVNALGEDRSIPYHEKHIVLRCRSTLRSVIDDGLLVSNE